MQGPEREFVCEVGDYFTIEKKNDGQLFFVKDVVKRTAGAFALIKIPLFQLAKKRRKAR